MEKALPRPRATSCLLAFPPSSAEEVPKGRERPGLLLFLSLDQPVHWCLPDHQQLPRRADRLLRNCSLSGQLQMCTAGPSLLQTLEFYLPEEGMQAGKLRLPPAATERDQGGDWKGRCQRGSPFPLLSSPGSSAA